MIISNIDGKIKDVPNHQPVQIGWKPLPLSYWMLLENSPSYRTPPSWHRRRKTLSACFSEIGANKSRRLPASLRLESRRGDWPLCVKGRGRTQNVSHWFSKVFFFDRVIQEYWTYWKIVHKFPCAGMISTRKTGGNWWDVGVPWIFWSFPAIKKKMRWRLDFDASSANWAILMELQWIGREKMGKIHRKPSGLHHCSGYWGFSCTCFLGKSRSQATQDELGQKLNPEIEISTSFHMDSFCWGRNYVQPSICQVQWTSSLQGSRTGNPVCIFRPIGLWEFEI